MGSDLRSRFMRGFGEAANQAESAPVPSPRDALRAAQQQAVQAAQVARLAAEAAARGLAGVEAARTRLAAYDGLPGRVAEHLAAAARQGSPAGPAALPAPLAAARRAKADAEEQVADATAAHSLLSAEAARAGAYVEAATTAQIAAVAGVMRDDAAALIAAGKAAEVVAGKARMAITSYSRLWSERDLEAKPMPPEAFGYVNEPQGAAVVDAVTRAGHVSAVDWVAYRRALMSDPDAILPVTP